MIPTTTVTPVINTPSHPDQQQQPPSPEQITTAATTRSTMIATTTTMDPNQMEHNVILHQENPSPPIQTIHSTILNLQPSPDADDQQQEDMERTDETITSINEAVPPVTAKSSFELQMENTRLKEWNQQLLFQIESCRPHHNTISTVSNTPVLDETDDKLLATMLTITTTEQPDCDDCLGKMEQLHDRLRDTNMILLQQSQESTTVTTALKETITSLTEQCTTLQGQIELCELSRLNDERQIQTLRNEMMQLQETHRQQMATIQIQHETDIQQQYTLMDTKSEEMRNIQEQMSTMQYETSILVSDLQEQTKLVEQSELWASELVSVTTERDLLQQSLHESRTEMTLLQNMIVQHSNTGSNTNNTNKDRNDDLEEEQELLPSESKIGIDVDDIEDDTEIIAIIQRQQQDQRETEISALTIRIDELQGLLSTKEEILAELTSHIEKLANSKEELNERLLQKSDFIQGLEDVVDELKRHTEMERQSSNDLQLDLTLKIVVLDTMTQKCNELEVGISQLHATFETVRNELQTQVTEYETKCCTHTFELEHHQKQVGIFHTETALLKDQLKEKSDVILSLEKVVDQVKAETDTERSRADVLQNDLTSLHQEMMVLTKNASEVESKLLCDMQSQLEHVDVLERKCESLISEMERCRSLDDEVGAERMLTNELFNEKAKLMQDRDDLLVQVGDLESALEEEKCNSDKERDHVQTLEGSGEALRQELTEATNHYNELQIEVERLTNQRSEERRVGKECRP